MKKDKSVAARVNQQITDRQTGKRKPGFIIKRYSYGFSIKLAHNIWEEK